MRLAIVALVVATFCCLPLRPLWVDEIYQLEATRDLPVSQVIHSSLVAPGGMPLGYLTQTLWLRAAGYSPTQARFPAALFGLASVFATAWIARQLSLNATLTTFLGLLTPILFRYSTEGRPYSQGLFFSSLSTALFLSWLTKPSKASWFAYLLCNVAGIYSQPFSLFTAVAHATYVLLLDRKRSLPIFAAIALTGAAYAPWFLLSQKALAHETWPHQMFFSWRQVSPLVIIKEISGGGYICSVSLVLLVFAGLRRKSYALLLCCATVPAVLAIAADAKFNYFFAIRQLIFVVPPLLLLATAATQHFWTEQKTAIGLLIGIYVTGAVVKDINWQRDRKEDWGRAASVIKTKLQLTGDCVAFLPPRDAHAYYFFEPSLRAHTCEETAKPNQELIAISPYASASERHPRSISEAVGGTLITTPAN